MNSGWEGGQRGKALSPILLISTRRRHSAFRQMAAMAIAFASAEAASAQVAPPAASQVVPRVLTPQADELAPPPVIVAGPTGAPPGASDLFFTPSRVVLEGAAGAEQVQQLLDQLAAKRISVAHLYEAAAEVERAYASAGLPFVRVVVPEQRLMDGAVARLVVVDGFVETIDLEAVDDSLRGPINRLLVPLVGRRGLRYADLERQLSLTQDLAGAVIRSTLAPGLTPGGVRLVIEGKRRLVTGSLSFDNRQSEAFDERSFTIQVALNSLFHQGEQIYLYASPDPLDGTRAFSDSAARRSFGGGVTVPVGANGLKATLEATRSITQPKGGAFQTRDTFVRYSARLSYPVVRTRRASLIVTTSAEDGRERNSARDFGVIISRDRFRVVRLGADASRSGNSGAVSSTLSLTNGFGDRPSADAPFSRAGTTRRFGKMEGSLGYTHALPRKLVGIVTVRGQVVVYGGLPAGELFALDGSNALAAFTAGELSTEEGFTGRFELRRVYELSRNASLAPYAYAAAGRAYPEPRTMFDVRSAEALGLGIEGNYRLPNSRLSAFATVEIGRRHADSPLIENNDRVSVAAGVRF